MIECNLNKIVYVRLNNVGRDVYKNYIEDLNRNCTMRFSTKPEVDENGFTKFQLWDLIHIFGEYIDLGLSTPFDKNCIYFKEMK